MKINHRFVAFLAALLLLCYGAASGSIPLNDPLWIPFLVELTYHLSPTSQSHRMDDKDDRE
jgi:hypothetical protein